MKKVFLAAILFSTIAATSYSQSNEEIKRIATTNSGFSTARSTALGGAFTSLGADMASFSINPAGIAMYHRGEISVTPSVSINSISINSQDGSESIDNKENKTNGNLNNLGVVFTSPTNSGILKSVSYGFAFNTSANTSRYSTVASPASGVSIGDMFASQLYGIDPSNIGYKNTQSQNIDDYAKYPSSLYGAIGAYKSGLIFDVGEDPYSYGLSYYNNNGIPVGSLIGSDIVYPELITEMESRIEDYNFAIGFDLNSLFYVGMTLGISDFSLHQYNNYYEYGSVDNEGDLDNLYYNQTLYQNGTAFNFLIGVTAQPIKGLRIGASYQAPKVYRIDEEYSTFFESGFYDGYSVEYYNSSSPISVFSYKVKTPAKYNLGISYTLPGIGLITADYERIGYDKMTIKGFDNEDYGTADLQNQYKAANNYKAGIEANIYDRLFLRGGYAYYGNADKTIDDEYGAITNISGGFGFRSDFFFIDLAYVNIASKIAPYRVFSYTTSSGDVIQSSALNSGKQTVHNIVMTLGCKF